VRREKLFAEADSNFKPGGKGTLLRHGWDAQHYVIFGPVIHHVTKRQDWDKNFWRERFDDLKYDAQYAAVDHLLDETLRELSCAQQAAMPRVIIVGRRDCRARSGGPLERSGLEPLVLESRGARGRPHDHGIA